MSELPNGWRAFTLAELAGPKGLLSDGDWIESKDQDPTGTIRLTQLADIGDGKFLNKSARYVNAKTAARLRCTFLEEGDLLIARMPDPLGRACIFPGVEQPAITAVDVFIWRTDGSRADARWVMYAINGHDMREKIQSEAGGTTRQRVAGGKLKRITLPTPSLTEQRRIVVKLDSLTGRTARAQEQLGRIPKLIQKYREAILSDVFSDGCTGSKLVRLADAIAQIRTGPFGSVLHKHEYIRGGIPLVNPMHIDDGKIIPSQDMTLTNTKAAQLKEFRLKSGDVIIGRRGVMGRCAVVTSEQVGWLLGTGSIAITPSAKLDPPYLQRFLSCPQTVTNLKQHAVGSTMVNLNQDILLNLNIPLPSIQEQQERIRRIETAFSWLDRVATEHGNASRLLPKLDQAILAKAFRGELVPQDQKHVTSA